jgi:hypothetical protein
VQLTPQNSEEQAMLDLMEMRGFSIDLNKSHAFLRDPNGYSTLIVRSKDVSNIDTAFKMFQLLNHLYK